MKTVEEILRESGLTDEQIKALDAKVLTGVTTVLSTANQAQEQAELARRAQAQQYDSEIAPALDNWANDKARIEAQLAFYKMQAEQAKAGGFLPADAPGTPVPPAAPAPTRKDRKSTRLNSSHSQISYAVFCLKKKNK